MTTATTIKNIMTSFLKENGIKDTDTTTSTNDRILVVAPNRFGYGYVTLISEVYGVWDAHFNKNTKLGTPKNRIAPVKAQEEVAPLQLQDFFDTLAVCAGYLLSEDPNQYSFITENFIHEAH